MYIYIYVCVCIGTLWEHVGPEMVVVLDIHDDVKLQSKLITKTLATLTAAGPKKQVLTTLCVICCYIVRYIVRLPLLES